MKGKLFFIRPAESDIYIPLKEVIEEIVILKHSILTTDARPDLDDGFHTEGKSFYSMFGLCRVNFVLSAGKVRTHYSNIFIQFEKIGTKLL